MNLDIISWCGNRSRAVLLRITAFHRHPHKLSFGYSHMYSPRYSHKYSHRYYNGYSPRDYQSVPICIPIGSPTNIPTGISIGIPIGIPQNFLIGIPTCTLTGISVGISTGIPTSILRYSHRYSFGLSPCRGRSTWLLMHIDLPLTGSTVCPCHRPVLTPDCNFKLVCYPHFISTEMEGEVLGIPRRNWLWLRLTWCFLNENTQLHSSQTTEPGEKSASLEHLSSYLIFRITVILTTCR